ncbi:hypothetical protein [Streptomyces sp. NPDC014676]|uniref:hypothetical protein n=1 Tax=Streptomyces sp. NPDC014676 TaxID=3364879 RepID=UPI0036FB523B
MLPAVSRPESPLVAHRLPRIDGTRRFGRHVGPLTGTVASGDSLEAFGGTLRVTGFGFITITCTATAPQVPGPFVFD